MKEKKKPTKNKIYTNFAGVKLARLKRFQSLVGSEVRPEVWSHKSCQRKQKLAHCS